VGRTYVGVLNRLLLVRGVEPVVWTRFSSVDVHMPKAAVEQVEHFRSFAYPFGHLQKDFGEVMATTIAEALMETNNDYALGYTKAEHERLIRQAKRFEPYTERLFRESGIASGHRVLDLGSGVGDVSLLLARIVGPAGDVVGIERDACSIARANARVAEAGLRNVKFLQKDVNHIQTEKPFDAVAGRFILMFLPDPASVLRSLLQLLKPGGIVAFQEPSWKPFLAFNAEFSLYSKLLNAIYETFLRSGVNPEMGPDLHRVFQEAGLPAPSVHMETALGSGPDFISLSADVLVSLAPLARQHNVPLEDLGSLATVAARIHHEVSAGNKIASLIPLVGVWARKPVNA
jgi:2-polyprenyl-3-methyl-5-hydroxy-6-metoxy-1,4-benzoquinol methylase